MTQSGFLAAALLAGLVLYIAARGRLKAYADVLFGPAPPLGAFQGIPIIGGPTAASRGGGGGGGPGVAAPAKGLGSWSSANDNAANSNWIGEAETVVSDAAKVAEAFAAFGG